MSRSRWFVRMKPAYRNCKTSFRCVGLFVFVVVAATALHAEAPGLLTADPGVAVAEIEGARASLGNHLLRADWSTENGRFRFTRLEDLLGKQSLPVPEEAFVIRMKDGRELAATQMSVARGPEVQELKANEGASRLSERFAGKKIVVTLRSPDRKLIVVWNGILRDGSNYLRQEITVQAQKDDAPMSEVGLIAWKLPRARVVGTVAGSPVVAGNVFAGFEHPLSKCSVLDDAVKCALPRELPIRAGHEVSFSSVIGVTPPNQLRRGFLNYVEQERAHPYRPFLHYNSWYDLGYFNPFDQAGALDRVNIFGSELNKKRGVTLDSFLFDDGWDDPKTLWKFNSGFPNGFTPVAEAAANYGAAPGVWMSPWGGYDKPKEQRLKYGRAQGFEANAEGFALSGPKYFQHFHDVCMKMMQRYAVNQFKFDGTGNVNTVIPGSEFDSDFAAAIALIQDLRRAKPAVYINLTTGTYPSPFWLLYADSIWRGGEDHDFAGVGSWRQKWITYRDADTYEHVVSAGPLYPLNSLMLHGLIYAQHAKNLGTDPGNDFADEVHDYFGTGTQLQEMYITPALLSKENWDVLAEAARWSRQNASVLRDTHWIGGNPAKLQVYGWASWSPEKAILVLRNPSDKPQGISLDPGQAFEIPAGAPTRFVARSPWAKDRSKCAQPITAGEPHLFSLAPFEVLTLEAMAARNEKDQVAGRENCE